MDAVHFHDYIIRPTLDTLGLLSQPLSHLILGTALAETGLHTLRGYGAQLGVFNLTCQKHEDVWKTWLSNQPVLADAIHTMVSPAPHLPYQAVGNLNYATAICAAEYASILEPFPKATHLKKLAAYWAKYYHQWLSGEAKYQAHREQKFADLFPKKLLTRSAF